MKLQEFILQKRMKIEQQKYEKENKKKEEFDRKRRNLEQLFFDIRYSREKEARKSVNRKKPKKRRTHKKSFSPSRVNYSGSEGKSDLSILQGNVQDKTYEDLYRDYKRIINSKKRSLDDIRYSEKIEDSSHNRNREDDYYGYGEYQYSDRNKQKSTWVNRRKSANNVEDRSPNRSYKETSPIKPKTQKIKQIEKVVKKEKIYYHQKRNAAQDIIMEMETDNFTDNDYLKSDRLMIQNTNGPNEFEQHLEVFTNRSYVIEGDLPVESAREIIEAAAIFIQKNYRGYRTRKLLGPIFEQIYRGSIGSIDNPISHEDDMSDYGDSQRDRLRETALKYQKESDPESEFENDVDDFEYRDDHEENEEEEDGLMILDERKKKSIWKLLER